MSTKSSIFFVATGHFESLNIYHEFVEDKYFLELETGERTQITLEISAELAKAIREKYKP